MNQQSPQVFDSNIAEFLNNALEQSKAVSRVRALAQDPVEIVRRFPQIADREIVALVCATMAFGSVEQIHSACERALSPLGDAPWKALTAKSRHRLIDDCCNSFKLYRYYSAKDLKGVLTAISDALDHSGSLLAFFEEGDSQGAPLECAVQSFAHRLKGLAETAGLAIRPNLLPEPERGSACKKLFLFLRWLVRKDDVDPGGWEGLGQARLIIPLDVHMTQICSEKLRFISKQANLRNALKATEGFRLYAPEDPLKYDFALTWSRIK